MIYINAIKNVNLLIDVIRRNILLYKSLLLNKKTKYITLLIIKV